MAKKPSAPEAPKRPAARRAAPTSAPVATPRRTSSGDVASPSAKRSSPGEAKAPIKSRAARAEAVAPSKPARPAARRGARVVPSATPEAPPAVATIEVTPSPARPRPARPRRVAPPSAVQSAVEIVEAEVVEEVEPAAPARAASEPAPEPEPFDDDLDALGDGDASPYVEPGGDPTETLADLEKRLDRALRDADAFDADPVARRRAAEALSQIAARLEGNGESSAADDDSLLSGARELLSTDYYMRQWGRMAMRNRSEEVDEFGLDPVYEGQLRGGLRALYKHYFRVETTGLEHLPADGAALLVANHGGALPWDGVMLKTALLEETQRTLRWLAEDFTFHAPFLGAILNRLGAVRACQENAERLLDRGALTAVFPEGIQGVGKLYRHRYQLQRFGRGGYVKLALRKRVPLLPVAIVGAEEASPLLLKVPALAKALGVPFLPVTPLFPWLGPLGLAPLPSRWRITIGPPIELGGGDASAEDAILVNRLNDKVRSTLQQMVDASVAARPNPWR